ncbi:Sin-like protein conserved region-domain-containing protein [Myxozyma melibiosi]|uniref:Sin-like protein conserved region-domain-containing protein n=1 Tax=Myxozyma melibiosi TaxID=54550 RepID=A0ABR1F2C3_9ASCO
MENEADDSQPNIFPFEIKEEPTDDSALDLQEDMTGSAGSSRMPFEVVKEEPGDGDGDLMVIDSPVKEQASSPTSTRTSGRLRRKSSLESGASPEQRKELKRGLRKKSAFMKSDTAEEAASSMPMEGVEPASAQEADDSDDPIVQTVPVFLSSQLSEHLHIMQYPVRSQSRPYTGSQGEPILDFRFKPKAGVVQVDVPINAQSQFYDREKGERWGGVERQTLSGVVNKPEGYMIGIFQNGELHLTPVAGNAQLRPSFSYVDKDAQTEKDLARTVRQDPAKSKEIRAVQMTVKSADNQAPRYSGALSARKNADDEPFKSLPWFDKDTEVAWELAEKLKAGERGALAAHTSKSAYSDMLRDHI